MRFSSVEISGRATYGLHDDAGLHEPGENFLREYPDLKSVLQAGALEQLAAAAEAGTVHAVEDLVYLPPIPNPAKILAVGINYQAHMLEMGREIPEYPWVFVRFPDSLVGHEQEMVRPSASQKYDFEGEFAVIIGRQARRVPAAQAFDFVAGYTCLNDGSIRDFQRHGSQFTPGKNFPSSGACGPWFVSTDEIPDPAVLNLQTRLNGEVMQQAEVSDLRFDVAHLIEYCSTFTQLDPGDVITTGTPGGVGAARKPPLWLKPGDTIEVEIDGIGVLRNRIVDETA
jgi:2-keto-4-pentenoate hydratase/2-oxohepta-3-ene-1,7-dioic acid hydratase in catechol pathway